MDDRLSTSGLVLAGLSRGAFARSQFVPGKKSYDDLDAGFKAVTQHIAEMIQKRLDAKGQNHGIDREKLGHVVYRAFHVGSNEDIFRNFHNLAHMDVNRQYDQPGPTLGFQKQLLIIVPKPKSAQSCKPGN